MPILRAARGVEIIIIGPLPWYAVEKCCTEQGHITNFDDPEYGRLIGEGVKEVGIHLRNLLHTRRIKAAKIVNPAALMGLTSPIRMDAREKTNIWGRDLVHPLEQGYITLARAILEAVNKSAVLHVQRPPSPKPAAEPARQQSRDCWTEAATTVASTL